MFFLASPILASSNAPHEIGGFRLGANIDDYEFIATRNILKQVVFEDRHGFRKGVIYYGACARPGEIVKLKLKYKDSSRKFYKKLFKKFKKKFGEPDEYRGDTFGIVKAWKWFFRDEDNNRISLLLQHNRKNPDESMGNTIKLTMPDRVEAERQCFNKMCDMSKLPDLKGKNGKKDKLDWEHLIPK